MVALVVKMLTCLVKLIFLREKKTLNINHFIYLQTQHISLKSY